jgi:phosphoribosylaminoimidazole (AIR) synthetase
MYQVFNMGIGMVAITERDAKRTMRSYAENKSAALNVAQAARLVF